MALRHTNRPFRPRLLHVATLNRRRVEIFGEQVRAMPNPWGYSFWRWDLSEQQTFTFVGDMLLHPEHHARLLRTFNLAVGRGHQVWVASQRGYFRTTGEISDRSFAVVPSPDALPTDETKLPEDCYFIRRKVQYERTPIADATARAGLDWALTHLHSAPWSAEVKFKPFHLAAMKRAVLAAEAFLITLTPGYRIDPEQWYHAMTLMWQELPRAVPAGHMWVVSPGHIWSPDGRQPGQTIVALVPIANPYFPSAVVMTDWNSRNERPLCGYTPDGTGFCSHKYAESPEVWCSADPSHHYGPGPMQQLMAQLMYEVKELSLSA